MKSTHGGLPARATLAPLNTSYQFMRRTTVLIADDDAIVKEGLVSLLIEHEFDVVGAVGDGHELLDTARRLRPDLIVTDVSMPGPSAFDVLDRLKAERVDTKIIVLTMHRDAELAIRAMRAGASGFLLKHSAGEELLTAIGQALGRDPPAVGANGRNAQVPDDADSRRGLDGGTRQVCD
jgi:DNA-binding NarL/FixJ family response regulator